MAAWRKGKLSGKAAAKEPGVAHGTCQRWARNAFGHECKVILNTRNLQ